MIYRENSTYKWLRGMGGDFAFIGNQYHLVVGSRDLYIDLLPYQLSASLPDNMKELLPEPEDIIKKLKIFEEK